MSQALLQSCSNCNSLKDLLCQIDDSIYKRIRNKWFNQVYNTDTYFNESVYKDLVRYKSILQKRIVNGTYPCSAIESQDIISKITNLINK